MERIDFVSDTQPRAFGEASERLREPGTEYSPGDFLRQFSAVIAICLGLALMADVLVTVVGGGY